VNRGELGQTAVYRLYDSADQLLYIGLGSIPEARWRSHSREKAWWPHVARKTVEWYDSFPEAARAEHDAIQTEHPRHNKVSWSWTKKPLEALAGVTHAVPANQARNRFREVTDSASGGAHIRIDLYGAPTAVIVPPGWYERAVAALEKEEKGGPAA
jgi:antitoxin (DNA-binding transcriptional repressor) of toxin-antitoxin stability system/predicted GIY-YIG superfamily endonuclease